MQARFTERRNEAPNIYSFTFKPSGEYTFAAGDYAELAFGYPRGGAGRRWFTIGASPTEDYLMITTKVPPHPSEYKRALLELRPGDSVEFSPAMGNFNLPRDPNLPLLFVAGGVGITPYRSMMKFALDQNRPLKAKLLYAAKRGEHIFQDLIKQVNIDTDIFTPSERHLSVDLIVGNLKHRDTLVYLSGPEPLMDRLHEELLQAGIPRPNLRLDYFPGYTEL